MQRPADSEIPVGRLQWTALPTSLGLHLHGRCAPAARVCRRPQLPEFRCRSLSSLPAPQRLCSPSPSA
eukprot:3163969-Amphidinium_carterae.1